MAAESTMDPSLEGGAVSGKAVVVTGGTTGIGRATALLLAAKGARVLIFGRHEAELNDAIADIKQHGEVHGQTADVARYGDVKRVFSAADETLGGLDILINNAALGARSVVDNQYERWQYIVNVNLVGYISCAHEAIERMRQTGAGHIVNVGSLSTETRDADSDIYVASKSGINGFTESLRKGVQDMGIKVSLIEPGLVGTNLQQGTSSQEQQQQERALKMLKAKDIAEAIYYVITQPKRVDVTYVQVQPHFQAND